MIMLSISFSGIWNDIKDFLYETSYYIIDQLPNSPFVFMENNDYVSRLLGYANYFLPINMMISTVEAWLCAVVLYYTVSAILRWIKAIK